MLHSSFYIVCLAFILPLQGQNYSKLCIEADLLFPESETVILEQNYFVEIIPKDDTIEIVSTNKVVTYVRKNADYHVKESIYFSSEFNKVNDIAACTVNLKTKKRTKFAGYSIGMYHSSNIFYDDNREAYFYYLDLEDQSITELEYKIHYSDPHLLPVYYFTFLDPVLSSSLTVSFPKDCEIGYTIKDQGQFKIDFKQLEKKGMMQYSWSLKNTAVNYNYVEGIPASTILPHVIFWVKKYSTSKGDKQVLSGINDLYGWYKEFVKSAKTKDEVLVKNIADSITKSLQTDYEKASAIYEWVQRNISYVAIEDGYSGFIPRLADDVIRKKYGDCKDMANLLVELMKNSGLDGRHVWIGTRSIPYTYYEVHTPIVDNHMIAAVKIENEYYFMDATGKFMPMGLPTSFIQGKVAMVEEKDSFTLKEIRIVDKMENIIKDSISIQVVNNQITSTGVMSISGYPMIDIKYELSYAKNISEHDYFKDLLIKGNNKFKLLNYDVDNSGPKSNSIVINYGFELNDYVLSSQKELFINMHISKTAVTSINDKYSSHQIIATNDYHYIKEDIFSLSIPEGYKIQFVPPNHIIEKEYLQYYCDYQLIDNWLILTRRFVVDYLDLDKEFILDYNNVVEEIQKIERSNISLITNP